MEENTVTIDCAKAPVRGYKHRQERWDSLSKKEKEEVKALPNFDVDIFKECTGIDVD